VGVKVVIVLILYSKEIIEEYEQRGWWGKKTLVDYVWENAARFPDKVAYVDARQSITWSGVGRIIRRLTIALSELGIKKDQFVVTQIPNFIEFVLTHYALANLGAVTVPVVMPFRTHELDYILDLSNAVAAVIPKVTTNTIIWRCYRILYEGTSEIQRVVIAANILK